MNPVMCYFCKDTGRADGFRCKNGCPEPLPAPPFETRPEPGLLGRLLRAGLGHRLWVRLGGAPDPDPGGQP